jgi:hypothetical protein
MKKQFFIALAILLNILAIEQIQAQISTQELSGRVNTITSAVPFLMITPDSRAGGMGDIGVATSPDANSQYWNAAKYSFLKEDFGVSISYTPWLRSLIGDISLSYITGYKKFNKGQALAVSLRYFSLGNIEFTDFAGQFVKDFRPNEFAFDASYSMLLADNLSGSISLRYIYSNLTGGYSSGGSNSHPGWTVAGDLSFFYTKDFEIKGQASNLSFGLQMSNIGGKVSYTDDSESDFIPTNLRIGSSFTYNFDDYNSLMVGLDFNKLMVPTPPMYDSIGNITAGKDDHVAVPTGMWQSFYDAPGGFTEEIREITSSIGIEYWYDKKFALRTGYFFEHATKGNRKFFTVGVGLKLNVFQLDFAYLLTTQQTNPLANTMRFSLLFDFKGLKAENVKPPAGG